jgi:hypothetical protein
MKKTVFISSTYEDLSDHRRAVWDLIEDFDAGVRGMEQFGARPNTPLQTCLAEVEQSDVYVGIIAFRAGSIETETGKSYTQLEYEHALRLGKDILVYMADEQNAKVRYVDVDIDPTLREKLKAFKGILRERHTVDTFTSPEDIVEKLRRDLTRYFESRKTEPEERKGEFEETLTVVRRFLLMPKTVLGREALFRLSFYGLPYPASRILCEAFNLDYGGTIGVTITVQEPRLSKTETLPFRELYATGSRADKLIDLVAKKTPMELYARMQFAEQDVQRVRGVFFGYTYYDFEDEPQDPSERYVAPEGKAILLFSKVPS